MTMTVALGNVDADFDRRCGERIWASFLRKALHDFFFFVAGEAAVQEAEL